MKSLNLIAENMKKIYEGSKKNPEEFWKKQVEKIKWFKKPEIINSSDFNIPKIEWFKDGELNIAENCVDIWAEKTPNKKAIIWENDNLTESEIITYKQLQEKVNKTANILKELKVKKGDVIVIYLPLIPEAIYSMLACVKIGAIHSVIFGGFSSDALKKRVDNSESKLIITVSTGIRSGKITNFKENVNKAVDGNKIIENILVINKNKSKYPENSKDVDYEKKMENVSSKCESESMNSLDPSFILYTSGSTGEPKGVVHSTGGYLVYAKTTFEKMFNYQLDDISWCTADIGWITGHTYLVYGPLSNGATILMHEGTPFYPDYSTHSKLIDKHNINIYYTTPTVIRALIKKEKEALDNSKRKSLKILGSVGEPLNEKAYKWYFNKFGGEKCPIIDTWWQTETGGTILTPQYFDFNKKPEFVGKPFFGVNVLIKNEKGENVEVNEKGNLYIVDSWPGQSITIFKNHERFKKEYFSKIPEAYLTGDSAFQDEDGDFRIVGRIDDVINVSGHRFGSAEIESNLNSNKDILESAAIGIPDELTGEKIYAFVVLKNKIENEKSLKKIIKNYLKEKIGRFASIQKVFFVDDLPKTRSGKIMRRILKKIVMGESDFGDTSTLLNRKVLDDIKNKI